MKFINRQQIKEMFKKVKWLRLDENFDVAKFEDINYYFWVDATDNV